MPEHQVHPWFASTTGITLTSHNGSSTKKKSSKKKKIGAGSLKAFVEAHEHGYCWMQIDAVPIKGDELISDHALLGRRFGFRRKTLADIKKSNPDATLLREILRDSRFEDVRWNIEVKSKHGLRRLLELLDELAAAGRDMRTIMISSPVRPSVLREVAKKHPNVALAAPLIHGGVVGVRFLGRKRARVLGKPYDCQQCSHWFVRSPDAKGDRPLRQVWTIRRRKTLHRMADEQAHMIVDSERLALPWGDPAKRHVHVRERQMPNVAVLALGGGGWRGAFGGIGAVLYFAEMEKWNGITEVVGISGGSFAVAALSAEPTGGPDEVDPGPRMTKLFKDLVRAGRKLADVGVLVVAAAAAMAVIVGLAVITWKSRALWLAVPILGVLLSSSFLVRSLITLRWKLILRRLFGEQTMRNDGGASARGQLARRYRIGATGLNDGNLYAYTSDPAHDRARWLIDRDLATPLGERRLSDAVLRATSLPGVGQFGRKMIDIACDDPAPHTHDDDCWVPDRLVDGGISGIFGRGLVEARSDPPCDDLQIVVVDAGRCLQVNSNRTFRERMSNHLQRFSIAVLLARWLKVAFDVAYRGELKRVADDEESDGYRCTLVRLAEEEHANLKVPERTITERRQDELNRLAMLRDRVHKFSLLKASWGWANRSVAVAVAACALDCTEEPDVEKILESVGNRLISNGHAGQVGDLADVWKKIPALGRPIQVA